MRQTEVNNLAGLVGQIHKKIVYRPGITQMLVNNIGEFQQLQTKCILSVGLFFNVSALLECGQDVMGIALGNTVHLRQFCHAKLR
ncbi:hypothetical protein SDC9_155964 [bioreactor metagenome]|uniref:Uncharacterized protein n=1 Tax=bioreactor metagenome TaxID=1076179 RepID=A0A645F5I3_9ZZZZ